MSEFDLVIRNGTVLDGTGADPIKADVAVSGGLIVAVGAFDGKGAEEIDATGLIVTPGFVDTHTHYDGQAIWSDRLLPSTQHGVTTAILGNCGVGFAPCRKQDHEELVCLMEGVEDIPEIVLTEGLSWDWETFPEYLDALERRPRDIDVGAYLPHSPLRVYVMGERAVRREEATEEDLKQMRQIVREAIDVGALGFATSRVTSHRNSRGEAIPTYESDFAELHAISGALKEADSGIIQVVPNIDKDRVKQELFDLGDVARRSGRPIMMSFAQYHDDPAGWRDNIAIINDLNREDGLTFQAQVHTRSTCALLGFDASTNPFALCPSYLAIADLPLAERMAELRKPEIRAKLLGETPVDTGHPMFGVMRRFGAMFPLGADPDYEPRPEESIAARAAAAGVTPEEMAYDLLLEDDGKALFLMPLANYADGDLEAVREIMLNDDTLIGLGDGGAHYGVVCDAGYPTFMLTYWARDRASGKLPLSWVIHAMTQQPAQAVGLNDRGVIAPGYKADINVIDYEGLKLHRPFTVRDLPNGGRRLTDVPEGYRATILSGHITWRDGIPTGALPGRLIRGSQQRLAA
ncbi:amidohydrolase [Sphingobium amiense]|uniref:Amidohydrolase n=1 Tax=Sphingobium amiense TaxID=135719 RepID=A0A494W1A3_9SPHN|nr:amidohydrolase family protein [Sphingobium amiense]BBD98384.1 amidohydrolase [Sphingobium amiense]